MSDVAKGIELRIRLHSDDPGSVLFRADSLAMHYMAKFGEHDADGWAELIPVVGSDGRLALHVEMRARELPPDVVDMAG